MGRAGADASNDGSFAWHTKSAAKSRVSQFLASAPILTATPTAESPQPTLTNHAMTLNHSATTRRAWKSGARWYTTLVDATRTAAERIDATRQAAGSLTRLLEAIECGELVCNTA